MATRWFIATFCGLGLLASANGAIQLPSYFGNGMVLQQEPETAHIWGTTDDTTNELTALLTCVGGTTGEYTATLVEVFIIPCYPYR